MKNRNDSPAPEGCTRRLVVPAIRELLFALGDTFCELEVIEYEGGRVQQSTIVVRTSPNNRLEERRIESDGQLLARFEWPLDDPFAFHGRLRRGACLLPSVARKLEAVALAGAPAISDHKRNQGTLPKLQSGFLLRFGGRLRMKVYHALALFCGANRQARRRARKFRAVLRSGGKLPQYSWHNTE